MGPTVPSHNDWQTEEDVRTLTRAKEITADADRHGRAKAHAAKKVAALKSIAKPADESGMAHQLAHGFRKLK